MDQSSRTVRGNGERPINISTNTFQIWETTVRMARIRSLMDHLCAANDENDELMYSLREPEQPEAAEEENDADEDDGSINFIIKDIRSRPRTRGAVKMIFYNRLTMLLKKLKQDLKFRSENAEFFDDLELVLSRMSDEAAEITKREIMKYLTEAKDRLAKRERERHLLVQQLQQEHHMGPASSASPESVPGTSAGGSVP